MKVGWGLHPLPLPRQGGCGRFDGAGQNPDLSGVWRLRWSSLLLLSRQVSPLGPCQQRGARAEACQLRTRYLAMVLIDPFQVIEPSDPTMVMVRSACRPIQMTQLSRNNDGIGFQHIK